ncbi:hypothetical protein [Massilia sp. H6]|uniref:hypothetical protein n=1 Tax=Massilia sp. H6 TaxID=2970464 RepID=UPI0021692148|nr:hypothetical protein [Massilia sp. H6]UVW30695.1 hypothetical protein NRS07_20260 [Massilia sp. H6]
MPVPLILWGAAALLATTGVVKGIGAMSDFEDAERIGKSARRRYEEAEEAINADRDKTNTAFEKLGRVKLSIFNNQIKHLVDVIKRSKNAKSVLKGFNVQITLDELKQMERLVLKSLEIEKGLGLGAASGALAAMGAYSGVGTLAAASTGTMISGLSGAAATNATLAWLGGGALSAGGFGMAGGAIALGGIVLGPALAIGGFMMASKAEEALTQARAYEAKADTAIAELKKVTLALSALRANAKELSSALSRVAKRFDAVKVDDDSDPEAFATMVMVGKGLKNLLDIAIMEEDGAAVANLKAKISGSAELS